MKKNVPKGRLFPVGVLLKTLLVMKLAIAIMLITAFQVKAGNASGQNISLDLKNTDVKTVLTAIEKNTRYRFLYNYDLSGLKARLDFKAVDAPVNQVLNKLLEGNHLTFKKLNRNLIAIVSTLPSEQNQIQVKGKITNDKNEAIVGATITEKGTANAVMSNEAGEYAITVGDAAVLEVSAVGYQQQDVVVGERGVIDINLVPAISNLDEVVVVGYGTQKKSVVTGAISSVKAKDLENTPNGRVEQALQGRVSGVTILQNNGQPGTASTIRVRGVTTFGDGGNNPLWVVDGIVVDAGGIGFLNQSDIESIEVLKDATSAAIYGTRAATGVILVTTKKGKSGRLNVSYNGFYGTSAPAKKLDLLNATQYATIINERLTNGGESPLFTDPQSYGQGTDWQGAIFNNHANRYLHEVSLSGGTDKSTFYFSAGLQNIEGIVATDISKYNKKNIRLNSTHKIGKIFTFGETVAYTHQKSAGLGNTNSEFGGPLSSAINLDPITPLVITDSKVASQNPYTNAGILRDANGNPYGISSYVGQEMSNPKAYILTRLGNYNWSDDIVGNTYLEIAPIKGLKIRSQASGKLSYWGDWTFTPVSYLSPTINLTKNSLGKNNNNSFGWSWENTIQYGRKFGEHDLSMLLGQGAYVENYGGSSNVTLTGLPVNSYEDASFNFPITQANRTSSSADLVIHKLSSLFGRLNYNYKEKYLFTGIIRRDGSTRFGINKKYGYFPSASVGWVISNEDFWGSNKTAIRSLKLRGGYGKVGNDNIANYGYTPLVVGGYNYAIGSGGIINTGYAPNRLPNPDLHWEETAQADIGLDAQLFSYFTLTVDVYNKKTSGILRQVPIPLYVGTAEAPTANIADMTNKGLEIELGFRKTLGEVDFGANGNVSLLKNEVTYVNSDANFVTGDASFQSMGPVTRTQVGESYNSFYGYKTLGIFQNQSEIDSYTGKQGLIQPDAKPGDFRWQDTNGDGVINESDKVFLGSSLPKITYGFTITAGYKGLDVMVFGQGAGGNKIFQALRRLDIANGNYQTSVLDRWTGEGTSNSYPRLTSNDKNGNFSNMSDFYLEKGNYLRLKVVQIGYTFHSDFLNKIGASKVRLYVTGENLATLTKYSGYDPEIGGAVLGIDKGVYPQARSFMVGAQLQF